MTMQAPNIEKQPEFLSGLSANNFEIALSNFFRDKKCLPCISNAVSSKFDINKLLETYYLLDDEHSRNMLTKIITYRLCRGRHYKLPIAELLVKVGTGEHFQEIDQCIKEDSLHFWQWNYNLFNLNPIGHNVQLYSNKGAIFIELILKQYAYERGNVNLKVEPGDYVIDGGACSGDTALYFAEAAGENGKVFSFEFLPDNLELFYKNLNLNPELKKRIHLTQNALWQDSTSNLFVKGHGPGTWCTMVEFQGYSMKVPTKAIDDFVKEEKIEKVDFIKLDIEGSELACLYGAKETIQKFKPKLAVCIYHKDEDFTTLAQCIKSILPDYKLYLDHYTDVAWETILYAICD